MPPVFKDNYTFGPFNSAPTQTLTKGYTDSLGWHIVERKSNTIRGESKRYKIREERQDQEQKIEQKEGEVSS